MEDLPKIAAGQIVGLTPLEVLIRSKEVRGVPRKYIFKVLKALVDIDCQIYSYDNDGNFDINFLNSKKQDAKS